MATVYMQAATIGQLISSVNVQRGLGFKPEGGLTFNGFYGQLMVTGSSGALYDVVAASDAAAFNAAMSTAITAGRVPLGKPEVLGGNIVQAVGDVSGVSSQIVSTDITDSSLIGRQILTAPDAPAVRTLIGATTTGSALITAADAAAARLAIGAGTSNLVIGTTASTAKAGNYAPAAADISDATATGRQLLQAANAGAARTTLGAGVTGSALFTAGTTGAALTTLGFSAFTQTLTAAADAAAYRTLIGAGTSNLAIGTTSTTAKRGDYAPAVADISGAGTVGKQVMAANTQAEAQTAIGVTAGGSADGAYYNKAIISSVVNPLIDIKSTGSSAFLMVNAASGAVNMIFTGGATTSNLGTFRGSLAGDLLGGTVPTMSLSVGTAFPLGNLISGQDNTNVVLGRAALTTGVQSASHLLPGINNTYNLGNTSNRWATVWVTSGSLVVSDGRMKLFQSAIPDAVLDAWGDVEWVQYKMAAAVESKGNMAARLHTGVIAQQVEQAFAARGLDAFDYGLLGYDEWDAVPAAYDAHGEMLLEAVAAGNSYVVRYDEAQAMEAAYMRRELARLKAK